MERITLIPILFASFSSIGTADTAIIVNGPLYGLRSPIEDPSPDHSYDSASLVSYGGGFGIIAGPVLFDGFFVYSSGNVSGVNSNGSLRQNLDYTDYSGRLLGGYRLFGFWHLDLYFGGAFGYGSAKRISDTRYEPGDEYEYPPYSFSERDESILTRYFFTAGPALKLDLLERFSVTGYFGVGRHNANRTGVWQSKYPAPPEYYDESVEYEDHSKKPATHTYINCRIKLFSFAGITAGAERINGPNPTMYAYIPESVFRYWVWDEPTYFVWAGPSFSF